MKVWFMDNAGSVGQVGPVALVGLQAVHVCAKIGEIKEEAPRSSEIYFMMG